MYSLSQIKTGVANPIAVVREVHQQYYQHGHSCNWNPNGTNIFDEDWDNLIILDACRYDFFKDAIKDTGIEGTLETRTSLGGQTPEFIPATFGGQDVTDTVYVTANEWYLKLYDEHQADVHDFISVKDQAATGDFVDRDVGIVHPRAVTEQAAEAAETYPDKRLLVHYLRPHYPFIGEFGREHFPNLTDPLETVGHTTDASRDTIRRAYRENLELVLDEVEQLLDSLTGKTVITADHGELLGDRHELLPVRDYGHHGGIYHPALVTVPWFTTAYETRRDITADPPVWDRNSVSSSVDEHLKNLGYKV